MIHNRHNLERQLTFKHIGNIAALDWRVRTGENG
jgi:hypothetical protein